MSFRLYRQILSFSFPVILSQGLQTAVILMDRYILSFKNPLFTTAATTAGFTALSLNMFFIFFISFSTALVARSYGNNDSTSSLRTLGQSLALCIPFSLICIFLSLFGGVFFKLMQHSQEFYEIENAYFKVIMLSYIPFLFKVSMESYLLGTGKSRLVLLTNLVGFLFNALLCYLFVIGPLSHFFKGIRGAAFATLIANTCTALFILFFASWKIQIQGFFIGIKEFLVQGFYTGLDKFVTGFCYVLFINMFVVYGPEVGMAVSIVSSWDQIAYLPLMGIYSALLSLYSRFVGKGKHLQADEVLHSTLKMTFVLIGLFSLCFLVFSGDLVGLFLNNKETSLNTGLVQKFGGRFFFTTSFYILFQTIVIAYKAALRSLGFSSWSFWSTFITNLTLILVSYLSVYVFHVNPVQVWTYFTVMVAVLAFAFLFKFYFSKEVLIKRASLDYKKI
jgi:multidrug resistance protein, MATE family